jgi:exonuclease SbcC
VVSADGNAQSAAMAMEVASSAAKELGERQRLLGELTVNKRLHDELDRAYTDLLTDLKFQLRPELSELASAYLSELTDGR